MPFTHIVSTTSGSTDGGNVTTSGINTTNVNLLVANISYYHNLEQTLTDSKSNTWVKLTGYTGPGIFGNQIAYCINPIVGTGHTFSIVGNYPTLSVYGFSNTDEIVFDQATGIVTGLGVSSIQPGNIVPSASNALVITSVTNDNTNIVINQGFSAITTNSVAGQHVGGGAAYKIQTTASGENPTWSWAGSQVASSSIASFTAISSPESGSSSGTSSLGSLISILSPDRQWQCEPGTIDITHLYSLVGLASMGESSTGEPPVIPEIPDVSLVIIFDAPTDYLNNNSGGTDGSHKIGNMAFDAGLRIPFVGSAGLSKSISLLGGHYNSRFKNVMASDYITNIDFPIYIVDTNGAAVDLTSFSTRNIIFRSPHGDVITVTPSYITDGSDGGIYYNISGVQFAFNGKWTFQVKLDGWYSNFYKFSIRGT